MPRQVPGRTATPRAAFALFLVLCIAHILPAPPVNAKDAPDYVKIHPDLVVNLSSDDGEDRFLLVTLRARVPDPAQRDALRQHMPAIRHELLLFMSEQPYAHLRTGEGRSWLQKETLRVVRQVMETQTGRAKVDGVVFSEYVLE